MRRERWDRTGTWWAIQVGLSRSEVKGPFLYTVGCLFHVGWCIRQLGCFCIIFYHNTSIAYNHHTDFYPLSNVYTYISDEESIRAESVFLVVGKAVPEGETTWVMMRDPHVTSMDRSHPRNFLLINPCTGHVFSAVDPTCPLKEICTRTYMSTCHGVLRRDE